MEKVVSDKSEKLRKGTLPKAFGIFIASSFLIVAAALLKFIFIEKIRMEENTEFAYLLFSVSVIIILSSHFIYVVCSRKVLLEHLRLLAAIYTAITLSVIANIYLEAINIYLMPVMLSALVIATLSHGRDAFMANIFSNILVFFILLAQNYLSGIMEYSSIIALIAIGLATGTIAAYWISNDTNRLKFLGKGLLISACATALVFLIITIFGNQIPTWANFGFLVAGKFGQVLVAFILQPVFESSFNLITNTRLVELTDHNMPLIKRLKEEAPGTFNHSLAVANFAEICASAIGENPYLARACAYYHDVGKLANPIYFKENQADGNPHDGLLPEVSSEIIRSHTFEGKKLCDEYRIPEEVSHVTIQHHGTLPIFIFYNKAKQLTDSEVDLAEYSYHGSIPVTKIAAIIMLCDSSEAAIRAMNNPDPERVDNLLRKLISDRIDAGQFDDCDISLRDLDIIRQTIISAYGGQFHKRLRYPGGEDK